MPPKSTKSKKAVAAIVEEAATVENTVIPLIVTSKKKAKKEVQVVARVTPDGIEGSFQPVETRRSLIAHLHIHSNEVQFSDTAIHYDPNPPKQPEPYDSSDADFFITNRAPFEIEAPVVTAAAATNLGKPVPIADPLGNPHHLAKAETQDEDSKSLQPFYRCNLMVVYRDTHKTNVLPDTVDIACFWCTEQFKNQPCIIPEREEGGTYKIYGNFCCPECAVSFLLSETLDPHVRWERMALLYRFYSEWYTDRIFPAPPRESLKKFGGPMSIEQFRNTIHMKAVRVDIQMPPVVSILGTMDTKPIDFYDTNIRNTPNGIIHERISRAEEGLRLRRNKPLKDRESTLDACMKISIRATK
jgi:hypothetical protein